MLCRIWKSDPAFQLSLIFAGHFVIESKKCCKITGVTLVKCEFLNWGRWNFSVPDWGENVFQYLLLYWGRQQMIHCCEGVGAVFFKWQFTLIASVAVQLIDWSWWHLKVPMSWTKVSKFCAHLRMSNHASTLEEICYFVHRPRSVCMAECQYFLSSSLLEFSYTIRNSLTGTCSLPCVGGILKSKLLPCSLIIMAFIPSHQTQTKGMIRPIRVLVMIPWVREFQYCKCRQEFLLCFFIYLSSGSVTERGTVTKQRPIIDSRVIVLLHSPLTMGLLFQSTRITFEGKSQKNSHPHWGEQQ